MPGQKNKSEIEREALSLREKICSYWAELLLLNMLAVLPLYMHAEKYISLTGHKARYLWISSLALFAVFAVIMLMFSGLAKPKGAPLKKTFSLPDTGIAAYWLCVVLSAVFSPVPENYFGEQNLWFFLKGYPERFDGIITITIYVFIYFAVSRLYRNRNRDWAVFAVSACAVSLIGILQFIGWDIFELYPYGLDAPTVVGVYPYNYLDTIFRTTLGNVNILSAYVSVGIGFFLALYMRSDKKIRFLYLAAVGLTFGLMITGGADGGKVGVLMGVALLFVLNITDKRAISRLLLALSLGCFISVIYPPAFAARDYYNRTGIDRRLYWGDGGFTSVWALGAVLCLAIGLAIHFSPVWIDRVKPRLAALTATAVILLAGLLGVEIMGPRFADNYENIIWQARETLHGNFDDGFGSGRAVLWKVSANVIFDYPLLGSGPDAFEYSIREYQNYLREATNTSFDKAHNDFLQILICHGFLGLTAFLLFIFSLAAPAFRKVWDEPLMMAAVVACAAYLVQAFFGISVPMGAPLFFVMCGLAENFRIGRHKFQYNE
ncbi:MAG: O-antigen ligase family protein [Oscillospiraceae bacterium]|nr:O-antigen ligase family protein [Oscillospiraceae bacterium]